MRDTRGEHQAVKGISLSRREFLRVATVVGAAGALEWLAGCAIVSAPQTVPATEPPAGASPLPPLATPLPAPTERPQATPTPTAIPDLPLFDPDTLAPAFVARDSGEASYATTPPFDPSDHYPEYPFASDDRQPNNGAYDLVREALRLMHPAGYGSTGWNPLRNSILPGDVVLIKPNLVDHSEWTSGQITHPAFLRPIIDYAYRACGPSGRIVLADGPWTAGLFDRLVAETGIQAMVEHLAERHGVPVTLYDLNKAERAQTPLVDLGHLSELRGVERVWYDAHGEIMSEGADPGIGSYRIAPLILEADAVISVPKAKVHCSSGITVAMKNMIGIIPAWDGPHAKAELKDCAHTSDADREAGPRGMYLDNDTIWRSMADLNRILLYADATGVLHPSRQRRYLAVVDGIVAAEDSQYHPRPFTLNTVIVGTEPVTVDAVTARCMGFDPRRLKSVTRTAVRKELALGPAHPSQIKVVVSGAGTLGALYRHALAPEAHIFPWQGHLEAEDFDPPEARDWLWDADRRELQVAVRDPSGVAWVRVAYVVDDQPRMKSLQLREGSPRDGEWFTPFPLGATIRQATLLTGDELFNETSREITW